MCSLTKERITWLHAFRSACRQHQIAFPIRQEATASAEELELATTARYRFSSRLRTESKSESTNEDRWLQPVESHVCEPVADVVIDGETCRGFHAVALVPGGRFLITVDIGFSLQLWDLGAPTLNPDNAVKAEIALPLPAGISLTYLVDVQVTVTKHRGAGMIVTLVTIRNLRAHEVVFLTYDAAPRESHVNFVTIGQFSLQHDNRYSCGLQWLVPQSNYLLVLGSIASLLWDYRKDTVSSFKFNSHYRYSEYEIAVLDTSPNIHLITWSSRAINQYRLPPSLPRAASQTQEIPTLDPLSTTAIGEGLNYVICTTPYFDLVGGSVIAHIIGNLKNVRGDENSWFMHGYETAFDCSKKSYSSIPLTPRRVTWSEFHHPELQNAHSS